MPLRAASTLLSSLLLSFALPVPAASAANGERTPVDLHDAPAQVAHGGAPGGGAIVRTIVGLAIVIAVIYGLTWVLRQVKHAREEQSSGSGLAALATLPLGPNRALHLVRAGDEVVLVGTGEGGVAAIRTYTQREARALGLLDDEEPPAPGTVSGDAAAAEALGARRPAWRGWLERLQARTVIK